MYSFGMKYWIGETSASAGFPVCIGSHSESIECAQGVHKSLFMWTEFRT